jgi:hypothetical protein
MANRLFSAGSDGRGPTGGAAPIPVPVAPSGGPPPAPPPSSPDAPTAEAIARVDRVIAQNRARLMAMKDVIAVRRGYKVTRGWISTTPCVVVVVRVKRGTASPVPAQIDGVPIDVAPATPREQLRASPRPRDIALGRALGTEELVRKSRYVPPPHLELKEVKAAMTVLCHTSPDAGWKTLEPFLAGTRQRLTIGMYDFTAPHIRDGVAKIASKFHGPLRLVLDPKIALQSPGRGGTNPKEDDVTEEKVKKALENAYGERFEFVWAAVKLEGKTTKGIFPSAYHIKVAVRDGVDFWLSSGNWQSSNQPDLDPLGADKNRKGVLGTFNREWHAIVEHEGLAKLYEEYLEWDMEQAAPVQVTPELARLPELFVPEVEEPEAAIPVRYFSPKTFTFTPESPLRVQPLLSPDNYAAHTLRVIEKARRTLYIQNQYIKIAKTNADEFMAILTAIKNAMRDGVDVRIIVRDLPDTRAQLEALQDFGFDMSLVKTLPATHTKGVIVDSKVVVVGSHNWSNDGVLYNRDASLIFHDADVAAFYQEIFLYDWQRATHRLRFESAMPVLASDEVEEKSSVSKVRRRAWTDVHEG